MNIAVTYPAPGLPPRRAFNVDDIRRMIEAGVIGEDERIGFVWGGKGVMAAKSYAHEMIKNALIKAVIRAAQPSLEVGVETTIQFSTSILIEPDIVVLRSDQVVKSDAGFVSVEQGGCSLIIEVSVSSLSY